MRKQLSKAFAISIAMCWRCEHEVDIAQLRPDSDNAALLSRAAFARLVVVPMASKRRAQLYTLPIVVGIGFLVGTGLAAWRRADLYRHAKRSNCAR